MSDLFVTSPYLVTNDPERGDGPLGVIRDGAVLIRQGRVTWVGPAAEAPPETSKLAHIGGDGAVLPGFVDSHTHLVFAGDRSDEFRMRIEGASYEQIQAAGGGIMSTVEATRRASLQRLRAETSARAKHMLNHGTTTVEIKSGYGLRTDVERAMLEVAHHVGDEVGIDVVTTFLGAHAVPLEFADDRSGYVDLVVDEMLPACAPLADFIDVFCDKGAFTVDEARRVLEAGRAHALPARVHAEQLGQTGAADLAAELGAASADHLDHVTPGQAAALARVGTVATVLPGAGLSMRTASPPIDQLRRAGVAMAIATDCNPGTSYWQTMPAMVALAVLECGMTLDEAVWAATRGGALALQRLDRGHVVPGALGDLVILDADHPAHLAYRPDSDLVASVVKAGRVVSIHHSEAGE